MVIDCIDRRFGPGERGGRRRSRAWPNMRCISSRTTFYQKRIFPVVFYGGLVAFLAVPVFFGLSSGRYPPMPVLVIPILAGIIIFLIMKKMVFDLVDEVWD